MTTTDAAEKKQRAYLSSGSGTRAFFRRPGSSGGEVVSATSGPPHGVPFARSSTVAVDTSATEKRRWSALRPGSSGSNNGGTRTFFRRPGSSGREVVSATPGPFSRSSTVPVDTGATDSTEKKRWSALNLRPGSSGNNTGGTSFFRRPGSSGGEMVSATPGPPHGVPFARSSTMDAVPFSRNSKRSSWYSLTSSSKANPNDLAFKTDSDTAQVIKSPEAGKTHFGMSFPSILGLSSLSRTSTRDSTSDEKDRGRSIFRVKHGKSLSLAPAEQEGDTSSRSVSRARSQSPFSFRRFSRNRDTSPTLPQALPLSHSDAELSDTGSTVHPRSTAFSDDDSGDENDTDDEDSSPDEIIDPITERNTERNAVIPPPIDLVAGAAEIEDPDPVGEGVNIVVAPEPYFPSTLNSDIGSGTRGKRNTRKRKTLKGLDPLPFHTARPVFQRDRCTITITQGDPAGKLGGRKKRRYVVASDLSEESRYAVEWGIGTVLRDGDEMWLVTVIENESKSMLLPPSESQTAFLTVFHLADPDRPNTADKTQKLRSQQEVNLSRVLSVPWLTRCFFFFFFSAKV